MIDIILTIVLNDVMTGDSVPTNDVAFAPAFPFLAPPNQPFVNGTVDDLTRN